MLRAFQRGEIRFLWIQATNPMAGMPDLSGYRPAAGDGDRFLVVSEAYPTATTREADVVLPAAMWLEREGIIMNGERRAQHFARMVRPPGDATSDGWQLVEVARRLGFATLFPQDAASHVGEAWEEYRRFHASPGELPSLSALRARAGVIAPVVAGREARWRYNVAHDPAADGARGAYDFHGHPDHRARIWLRPAASDGEAPDAAYPMRLHVGAVLEHTGTGTVTRRIPPLRRAMPAAYAELNREDAARLGIRDGDRVRVLSRRGRVETVARIERRSQPHSGSVFIPWFDDEVVVGALLPDARSPVTGQPEIGICAVRVERVGAGSGRGDA
jgi:nitrate reductase NapA